jgi:glucose/mannose-6-phosphate isomerase
VILDHPERYADIDASDALGDVEASADQWQEAANATVPGLDLTAFDAVLLAGMGGSGIAGDIAAVLAAPTAALPVVVHKGYGAPAFVGPRTLVVALSYSGDTEETLSTVAKAADRGARVVAVTSGGELARRSDAAGWQRHALPAGRQPRHSLGYLTVPLLRLLGLDDDLEEVIAVQRELLLACGREVPAEENPAKQLGLRIASGSYLLAYGAGPLAAVAAYRLRCQVNENAKSPGAAAALPELNHNEVVGFAFPSVVSGHCGLVLLRDPEGEHPRMGVRVGVTEDLLAPHLAWSAEVTARGRSPLARLASLLLVADLASVYAAIELGRDPTPIGPIDRVKSALSTVGEASAR